MAKLAASEAAHKAADRAMQILASAGYRRGSVVERLFRDVRATEIYQGTSEAQRMIIASWRPVARLAQRSKRLRPCEPEEPFSSGPDGAPCRSLHSRREFAKATGSGRSGRRRPAPAFAQAPAVRTGGVKPVVIASANGNRFKNGDARTGVELAFATMTAGGDVLDALIAGVNIVELDPADTSVGYGGLPNADGVVQLDACCMHGPRKRAGGVASLEGVKTPSRVAQQVMDDTDHHLLVGQGAQGFARNDGLHDRKRSEHRAVAPPVARVEAADGSRSLPRPGKTRAGVA